MNLTGEISGPRTGLRFLVPRGPLFKGALLPYNHTLDNLIPAWTTKLFTSNHAVRHVLFNAQKSIIVIIVMNVLKGQTTYFDTCGRTRRLWVLPRKERLQQTRSVYVYKPNIDRKFNKCGSVDIRTEDQVSCDKETPIGLDAWLVGDSRLWCF